MRRRQISGKDPDPTVNFLKIPKKFDFLGLWRVQTPSRFPIYWKSELDFTSLAFWFSLTIRLFTIFTIYNFFYNFYSLLWNDQPVVSVADFSDHRLGQGSHSILWLATPVAFAASSYRPRCQDHSRSESRSPWLPTEFESEIPYLKRKVIHFLLIIDAYDVCVTRWCVKTPRPCLWLLGS